MNKRANNNVFEESLVVPFLDNFIDDKPEQKQYIANESVQLLGQFKESIRRDLEQLLNTRYRCQSFPPELKHSRRSTLNYGIPDLSSINLLDANSRSRFCGQLEAIIRQYEPRFKSVKVLADANLKSQTEEFQFSVEALVNAEPAPILMVFDSTLEPVSSFVEVSESEQ